MPKTERTRLATSPSFTARMSGMPPATDASKPSMTPRSSNIARSDSSSLATPAPTVPRPSNPMRTSFTPVRSTPEALQAAQRLTDALLVFHQREPDEPLAVLTEADPGRDGDLRLLDQELREFQRAHAPEILRNRRPDEHGALRLLDRPAELVQPIDQDVAALARNLHDVAHDGGIALQRDDAGDLDGLEGSVVEIRLDASQRVHHLRVAADETEPPARHVVGLRRREDLHADVLGARHLEERRRLVTVEREVGVGEVVDDHEPVLLREGHDLLEEPAVHA